MKHLLLLLLFVPLCTVAYGVSERANTVLIHPGETIYARFMQKGLKLKLISATKEKDEQAQLALTMDPADPAMKAPINLKIISKFALELHYRTEVRAKKDSFLMPDTASHVVAGKMALMQLPPFVDEAAVFAFELEK